MISKIKLIKTYPNSPESGTEYFPCNYKNPFYKNIFQSKNNNIISENAINNSEYYEIIYQPKFKIGDFVNDGIIEGFVIDVAKFFNKYYKYKVEYKHILLDKSIIDKFIWLNEEELQISANTIKLFDKIYFEKSIIWLCAKNGRKQPKQITVKMYLEHIKSNNIQHFEIFETKEQADEWFEENQIRYSKKNLENVIELFTQKYSLERGIQIHKHNIQNFIKEL